MDLIYVSGPELEPVGNPIPAKELRKHTFRLEMDDGTYEAKYDAVRKKAKSLGEGLVADDFRQAINLVRLRGATAEQIVVDEVMESEDATVQVVLPRAEQPKQAMKELASALGMQPQAQRRRRVLSRKERRYREKLMRIEAKKARKARARAR